MATTVRASSRNQAASGTAISVAAPTGTVPGDVVIVIVHANQATTIVDNNGSTPFTEDLNDFQQTLAGSTVSVFSRRIVGGDPSTYAFTSGVSDRWTAVAVTFQSPHASAIYDVAPTSGNSTSSSGGVTTQDSQSITTLNDNAIHCAVCCPDGASGTITGTPAGYTVEQNGGNQAIAFGDKVITPAGATGAQTWSGWASDGCITLSFAIRDIGGASLTTAQELPAFVEAQLGGGMVGMVEQ